MCEFDTPAETTRRSQRYLAMFLHENRITSESYNLYLVVGPVSIPDSLDAVLAEPVDKSSRYCGKNIVPQDIQGATSIRPTYMPRKGWGFPDTNLYVLDIKLHECTHNY